VHVAVGWFHTAKIVDQRCSFVCSEKCISPYETATHIGVLFAWPATHGMVVRGFVDVSPLVDRTTTPGRFLLDQRTGDFDEFMLTMADA
jgi:hypothetical protein